MDTHGETDQAGTGYLRSDDDVTDEDPFQTDEDSDYDPSSEGLDEFNTVDNPNVEHVTPKKTRKRRKNVNDWSRAKRKTLRLSGEKYVTRKGKTVKQRKLQKYQHSCRYDCKEITEQERETLFTKFYGIKSYDLQTCFIASCIKKISPSRIKRTAVNNKTYITQITVMNFRVCKEFFLKTLDITNRRFSTVCKKISKEGIVEADQRGKHTPSNKMSNETKNDVIAHIKAFPRYKSHYSRSQNANTRYLSQELNIRKMYVLYREWCTELKKETVVKESYYRNIFCTEFNLKFHKPHSDTCHTCDHLNNLIKNSTDEDIVNKSKVDLELHQRKAESVIKSKNDDVTYCKLHESSRAICFDLQKTLPTPLLTTSKVFYLRQLWTYNFCIYDLTSGKSYMYVWNETIASRGSQEIGSCLLKFIQELPTSVEHLICYSDSCGGQNKNKNISKLFMYLVQCTKNLKKIDHKFFEPGHSYMECDRSFGIIEKRKKNVPQVYIPKHWTDTIRKTSRNFHVYEMTSEDFFSFDFLNTVIKDPKKSTGQNKPLKWRDIVWFCYEKENLFSFTFKDTRNAEYPFSVAEKCGIVKSGRPSYSFSKFNKKLNNGTLKIKFPKWENLIQLLPFIPPVYHDFYKNMAHETAGKKKGKSKMVVDEANNGGEEDNNTDLESDYEEEA